MAHPSVQQARRLRNHKKTRSQTHGFSLAHCGYCKVMGHHVCNPTNGKTTAKMYTLWLFNIAVENGLFIDDFPLNTYIYKGFSMAMLNSQMVPI